MKKSVFLVSFAFILVANVACKPKAVEVNKEYIGTWEGFQGSSFYQISILSNGAASYAKYTGPLTVNVSGKARVKGDKFKIGIKKFELDQEPTLIIDSGWSYYEMILDGIVYERY